MLEGQIFSVSRGDQEILILALQLDGDSYWAERVYEKPASLINNQIVVLDGYYVSMEYLLAPPEALTQLKHTVDKDMFLAHKALSQSNVNKLKLMRSQND